MDRYMPMKKSKGRLYELLQSGFLEILLDGKKRKKQMIKWPLLFV